MLNFSVVFPGQGSQSLGMLKLLSEKYTLVKETFECASDIVGFDCWHIAQQGPEATLNQTAYTQPILLAANIAAWRVYQLACPHQTPAFLAGHSLGEYAALVAAQALSFEDAIKVVAQRGRLMQQAAPFEEGGCMAAILGLDNEVIETICQTVTQSENDANYLVAPANYNAIGQTVIAGHPKAVAKAIEYLKEKGAKRAIALPVSVPSHCALMQPAFEAFSGVLDSIDIKAPLIPVLHNRDVKQHTDPKAIKQILCEQLIYPVRWVQSIQALSLHQMSVLIECGPGKVLSGLIKRIEPQLRVYNIDTPENLSEVACL